MGYGPNDHAKVMLTVAQQKSSKKSLLFVCAPSILPSINPIGRSTAANQKRKNEKNKTKRMKNKFKWVSAITVAVTITSQVQTIAQCTNVILITTRKSQDLSWSLTDSGDVRGPGQASPGDVAMGALLGDYGYATRLLLDAELNPVQTNPYLATTGDPDGYEFPVNPDFNASLILNSGSSGSADIGSPNTNGIPIIMGEHSCISDVFRPSQNSLFMYAGAGSDDVRDSETGQFPSQYMKVIDPTHPIMQGIPLDAQGRVKIFRDRYPEEGAFGSGLGAHTPTGGKFNYEYAWTTIPYSQKAAGTTVIGVMELATNKAVFAVADIGATLAPYTATDPLHPWSVAFGDDKAHQRLVHFFINEQGSGNSRRCFNSLTDIGKVIFIRTVKWAIGCETLAPYVPLNINISLLTPTSLQLSWTGTADKNYKVLGSANIATPLFNWETLKEDIAGVNGTITKTVNIASAPQAAFLIVQAVP